MSSSSIPKSSHAIAEERTNHCFGCGSANPQGLHLVFRIDNSNSESITVVADVELTRLHEGPPGYIHGGIVATLLDEAMSKLSIPLKVLAVTRRMEIDYIQPAPLNQPLILVGRHIRQEGRKLFHEAELQKANGQVLAHGKGLFIVLSKKILSAAGVSQP